MQTPVAHKIFDQQFWLTADRTMYWEEEHALIVSDLHFGKTGHFRKSGIPVPASVYKEDLQRLVAQIQHFQPRKLIIVGDMFHSHANRELELFLKWREDLSGVEMQLVQGNHDILKKDWYTRAGIKLISGSLSVNRFAFVHDISDPVVSFAEGTPSAPAPYFFSGHLHPGVRLNGAGRQSLCFPCFYFGRDYAVLQLSVVLPGWRSSRRKGRSRCLPLSTIRLFPSEFSPVTHSKPPLAKPEPPVTHYPFFVLKDWSN